MRAIFIVDFEMFYDEQIRRIATFRKQVPPSVPVIWTITGDEPTKPGPKEGFYASDRLFIKSDIEASFDLAADATGQRLMDFLRASNITEGYLAGGTFYGCVMVGGLSLREVGIFPVIMTDLTDYSRLADFDHEEAAEDWQKNNIPVVSSQQVLTILRTQPFSPKPL